MAPTAVSVVSLEVQEDDSTVIVLRVSHQWICAEANRSDLQNTEICKQYDELVEGYRRQKSIDDQLSGETACPAKHSGYGSSEDVTDSKQSPEANETGTDRLRNWMIEVLSATCNNVPAPKYEGTKYSLADWYIAPIGFYNITANIEDAEHLAVEPRNDLDGTEYIHNYLLPHIPATNCVQGLDLPWYAPEEILVEDECEDESGPLHPTLLSVPVDQAPSTMLGQEDSASPPRNHMKEAALDRTQFFFKLATHGDASSMRREIKILDLLRKKDLFNKGIRAPRLAGLVQMPQIFQGKQRNWKGDLLGILLTIVPSPALPLNHFMVPDLKQEQRAAYAAEAQAMVDVLHQHDIVWGDAKADNFLVDGAGKLWMIDFGGNYTPGWIDADLVETVEGDNMGTEKIRHGLENPEDLLEVDLDEDSQGKDYCEVPMSGSKRNRAVQNGRDNTTEEESNSRRRCRRKRH